MEGYMNAEKLVSFPRPSQVGVLVVTQPFKVMEHFEFAAWYREHEVQPGRYPIIVGSYLSWEKECRATAKVKTKVTAACLQSHFGGVGYGQDTAGKREVGREYEHTIGVAYALWIDADHGDVNRLSEHAYPGARIEWTGEEVAA
jgi:hypothetical protein